MMKKSIFPAAAIALAISAGSAVAADLPFRKGPPPYIAPGPVSLWTGFYVGINAGGTWSQTHEVDVVTSPLFLHPVLGAPGLGGFEAALAGSVGASGAFPVDTGGFIGGGQIGYNQQFNGFVAGVEADIQGVATGHEAVTAATLTPIPGFAPFTVATTIDVSRRIDFLGTVRGRLGYLVTPTLLLYGTGGLAYGEVSSSLSLAQVVNAAAGCVICSPFFATGSFSDTRVGWTAGGGGEWMLMPNWSIKVEYLYYDLGNVTFGGGALINPLAAAFGGFLAGTPVFGLSPVVRTRFNGHIVRAGLNYHFHMFGAAPILASY